MEILHSRSRKCATLFTAVALVVSGVAFSSAAAHAEGPQAVEEQLVTEPGEAPEVEISTPTDDETTTIEQDVQSDDDGTPIPAEEPVVPESVAGSTDGRTSNVAPLPSATERNTAAPFSSAKKTPVIKITSRTKSTTSVGKKLVVKGKTSASLKGKGVELQLKSGKKWIKVASARVKANRTFSLTVKATKAGKKSYRVAYRGSNTIKAKATKAFRYNVWKWYNLTDNRLSDIPRIAKFGGKSYPNSVVLWYSSPNDFQYNVNYACTKLKTSVGMTDTASSNITRNFWLTVDDIYYDLGTHGIGKPTPVNIGIKGAYRITLGFGANQPGNNAEGAFVTPKVYCLGHP